MTKPDILFDAQNRDAQNRSRAISHHSFIVEAPAGAGKTELLTQRFLSLLQVVNAPEEIVAITFTNKAAAEMRLRILESLLNAAKAKAPELAHKKTTYDLSLAVLQKSQTLDWHLLENPSRLRIFTIDGLCGYLARQMPLMSRFGAQPNIADDPSEHYAKAVERTLALIEDEAHRPVVMEALRYFDNDANQLKKLLILMLGKREQWLHYAQQAQHEIGPKQLQATLSTIVAEELKAIAQVINIGIQTQLMPLARFAASNVACDHSISLLRDWDTPLLTQANSLPMWQALSELMLTGKGELRKRITKDEGFPAEEKDKKQAFSSFLESLSSLPRVEQVLARIKVLPHLTGHEYSWQMISSLSSLLNLAAAQLWLVFTHVGEVDFAEVAQRASLALASDLGEPTELALKLDYQIKHLLVDEFQDTSPSQMTLLEKLTQGWQPDDGRTLFAVGDPMQSIYRFRKANVGLFLNAAEVGIGDVALEKLSLYRNNRSCPPVIDWINQTFATVFPSHDDVTKGAIHYRPFMATRADEADTGVIIQPVIKHADESLEEAKLREAKTVVEIILHERKTHPNRKIAILVRAKAHLSLIVSELRRNHKEIHFQAVEIEPLASRQIVQDLRALTHALLHRADRVHWLATLRAPWCGLTLNDLHALAGHDHESTIWSLMQKTHPFLSEEGQKRLGHVRDIFSEAFAQQGRTHISRWVRGVWLMLGGASCLWEQSDVVDVQAFFDCLEMLDRSNQFSLERMETEILKLFAAPDTQGEYIQMMTIHKSKGLEFDTVILPGLGHSTNGNDDKPIVLWEEVIHADMQLLVAPLVPKSIKNSAEVSPYDYLTTLENERASHEDLRVLYVAATRAEKKLYCVGIANQNKNDEIKPTKNSYLDLLWPAISSSYLSYQENEMDKARQSNTLENFIPKLVRLENLEIPLLLKSTATSNDSKPRGKNIVIENNQTITKSLEADIGTLTHRYLELMAKQGLEHWSPARVLQLKSSMQFWFKQQNHEEKSANEAAEEVQNLLIKTLNAEEGRWILQTHSQAYSELTLAQFKAGEVNTNVVDRTFVTMTAGKPTRWIIDYKTVQITTNVSDLALKTIAEQYREQLENYQTLFDDEGLPIQKAIYFVRVAKLFLME